MTGFFDDIGEAFSTFFDDPLYYIGLGISSVTTAISTFFTETIPGKWAEFKQWISDTVSSIGEWFQQKWDDLKEAIPKLWEDIKTGVSDGFDSVKESIETFFTETIPKKWDDFKRAAKEKIDGIGDWFEELPEKLKNIGKNIVDGLKDGIEEKWNGLKETVSGWADSFTNGFKDGWGINSPSKVFASIGGFLAEGLEVGWDDKFQKVKSDIEGNLDFNGNFNIATGKQEDRAMYFNVISPDGKSLARFVAPYMGAQLQLVGG